MEHVEGVQLHKKWPEMAGDEWVRCINAIYRKLKEIVDLQFPAFGSVNFEANLQSGCKGISWAVDFVSGYIADPDTGIATLVNQDITIIPSRIGDYVGCPGHYLV